MPNYPLFSGSSSAAILALTAIQTARGADPAAAVERAARAWHGRLVEVGTDSCELHELTALVEAVLGQPG
ncbi:hypothetical protein [Nocardioides sp. SYSU D00038]|uniref:hypothetical protein n=1 Tax=Nocardioides sp. SYSU D00038 TaxID=2812554 RepID=UPI0019670534|nr:hypothetical protein [Nocardioides sp. SYSU D00038]